jgi:hypothetical protein
MCGAFLSRTLDADTEERRHPMNPNQMNYFNALVAQHELRDEARRSRTVEGTGRPAAAARVDRTAGKGHSLFGMLHLAFPGRR